MGELLLILLSPFVGSFLGVLVDRLPRGEDVLFTPSYCRSCGLGLRPWQLLPLVSFALARGRCGGCGTPIPPILLYLEITALGAAILTVIAGGDLLTLWLTALFLWLLLALAVCDALWLRLPDPLVLALALVSLGLAMLPGGLGLQEALIGAVLGVGSFWILRWTYQKLRRREGLGFGDVKLMAGLGAFAGGWDLPLLVLIGATATLLWGAVKHLRTARDMAGHQVSAETPLPFGSALCAAAAILWLLRAAHLLPS